jgi:hypothetical protein
MRKMHTTSSEIFQRFQSQNLITGHTGTPALVTGIAPVEDCSQGDLVFIDHPNIWD